MRRLRATSGLIVVALLVSACGARLTEERRQIAIDGALAAPQDAGVPGSGTGGGGTGTTSGTTATTGTTGATATGTTSDGTAPGDSTGSATTGTTTTGTAPGSTATTTGEATTGSDDGSGQTTTGTTGQQPAGTRAMPPGGNGGATDVGVTESQIFIANVSDLSGPVPGLFEEAQIATKAAIEWFKATEGTIYGRTPEYLPYDAKMDTSANRAAYQDACDKAFAVVGSWSAFDQGAAEPVESCVSEGGPLPDLRTVALTPKLQGLENMVSADAMKPYHQPVAHQLWVKQRQPEVITDSAYLYIAGEVTAYNSGMERWAATQVGYEWDVVEQIEVSESNYAPYVLQMKNAGVKHVQFQGAYQQAVKLAKAMRQQNYWPESVMFQANVYTRDFLELGGDAIEGVVIPLASFPLEELDANAEARTYAEWYQRVAPNKNPTAMGMYSWAMTKLFFEAAKAAGPQLTRQKILDHVRAISDYTGNGLFAPQDYATKTPSACTIMAVVQDGRFTRQGPAQGYYCEGGAYEVPEDEIE